MIYSRVALALIFIASNLLNFSAASSSENIPDMPIYIPEGGQINITETRSLNATTDADISSYIFVLAWLNDTSKLDAVLISPSGVKIDSTVQPPIVYGVNGSMIFYILPDAEKGKWTSMITARDVPDTGESYWALFGPVPENK
jgi:hypothetical protein